MSSFNNVGKRQASQDLSKTTKAHVKAFYKIIGDMDRIAKELDPNIEYNEENINDYVRPLYRALDPMEKFLLLGKLHNGKEDNV